MTLSEFMTVDSLIGCTRSEIRLARNCLADTSDKERLVSKVVQLEKKGDLSLEEKAARIEVSVNEYRALVRVLNALGYGPHGNNPLLDYDKPKAKALYATGLMSVNKMGQELKCDPKSILEYLDSEGLRVKRGDLYMSVWYPLNMYRMMTDTIVHEISRSMGKQITSLVDKLPNERRNAVLRYFRDLEPIESFSEADRRSLDIGVAVIKRALGMGISMLLRFKDDESRKQYARYQKLAKESAISIMAFQDLDCLSVGAIGLSPDLTAALKNGGVKYIMDSDKIRKCGLNRKQKMEFNSALRRFGITK